MLVADINEWVTDQHFDVIVLPDVLEHIPIELHKGLFKKLKNLLKPRGFILIHIPNPYYLDFCIKQGMEMQIIDQPVYIGEIIKNLKGSGLFIKFLEVYSIWQKEGDYQVMVLEHEEKFNNFSPIELKIPIWKKAMQKVIFEWEKLKRKGNG